MRRRQAPQHLSTQLHDLFDREPRTLAHASAERLALDVLHRQIGERSEAGHHVMAEFVDPTHMRIGNPPR
jgi:hypothetical protein